MADRAWTVSGRTRLRKTAPSPAMPVEMPTWRNVLDEPDAMPLRSGGTTDTVAEASTGLVMPTPMPAVMNPGSRTVHDEVASTWLISSHPTATRNSPSPSR